MGWWQRIKARFAQRDMSPSDPRAWTSFSGLAEETSAGVKVDHDRALGLAEIYSAIRACSEDLAAMPLLTYRRGADGSRKREDDHITAALLEDSPNPYMTGQDLREALGGQVELRGNAYAEIERNGAGRPVRLWPLRADRTEPFLGDKGGLYYRVGWGGGIRQNEPGGIILPARLVLHLHGFSSNGIMGYDPIALHREGIGNALALQEYGARFFGNGSRPGGVLSHPGKVSPEAKKAMKESWELTQGGLKQSHRVALLEEGVTWTAIGISPEHAQFIESKKLKVSDAARIWRYPSHMLGDLERSTDNNIEQQALEYVIYTLLPRAKRIEGRVRLSLLAENERRSVFVEHLFAGLLRGDLKARYEAYQIARQGGWLSVNDIRRLENMNSIGPEGDIYLSPLNMVPAGMADAGAKALVAGKTGPEQQRMLELVGGRNGH